MPIVASLLACWLLSSAELAPGFALTFVAFACVGDSAAKADSGVSVRTDVASVAYPPALSAYIKVFAVKSASDQYGAVFDVVWYSLSGKENDDRG